MKERFMIEENQLVKSKIACHFNKITKAELVAQAYELRLSGLSTAEVAERLGISRATVSRYVNAELERVATESVERLNHLRAIEDQRLEACWRALWPRIREGNIAAIAVAIRLSERKSRLWGLDAAIDVRVTEAVNSEINEFLKALRAALPPDTFAQIASVAASIQRRSNQSA
jgi:transcriptional regulator with XRE-family HTH domain